MGLQVTVIQVRTATGMANSIDLHACRRGPDINAASITANMMVEINDDPLLG